MPRVAPPLLEATLTGWKSWEREGPPTSEALAAAVADVVAVGNASVAVLAVVADDVGKEALLEVSCEHSSEES